MKIKFLPDGSSPPKVKMPIKKANASPLLLFNPPKNRWTKPTGRPME